jgi:hypothetical protein
VSAETSAAISRSPPPPCRVCLAVSGRIGQRHQRLAGPVAADVVLHDGMAADSDEAGRGFRFEAGHGSDLKPATVPI